MDLTLWLVLFAITIVVSVGVAIRRHRFQKQHKIVAEDLAAYVDMRLQVGLNPANEAFPEVVTHLKRCKTCRETLQILISLNTVDE